MPWKNQGGGGPWGSGPKGPWGQGPQSVGPRPPDLEDLLRRGQDKMQQLLPGGHLGGMGIALILVGALAIWGLSGFFRVQSEELGAVLRFGKHVRTVQPDTESFGNPVRSLGTEDRVPADTEVTVIEFEPVARPAVAAVSSEIEARRPILRLGSGRSDHQRGGCCESE